MSWDMSGKYCIVTGASSGIGKAIAHGLASGGANVTIVCRDAVRGREARDEIVKATGNESVEVMLADLAYAQSKLADVVFSHELGRRLDGTGVTVNCVCPGAVSSHLWEKSSRLVHGFFTALMKGPQEGARLPLYVATSQDLDGMTCCYFQTGQHLKFSRVRTKSTMRRSSAETDNREVAARLWEMSEKLTGVRFGG